MKSDFLGFVAALPFVAWLTFVSFTSEGRADEWQQNCVSGTANTFIVQGRDVACWFTDNTDGTLNSPGFFVDSPSALVYFAPQTDGTGPATAEVTVHGPCVKEAMPGANPENECPVMGVPLTGAEGAQSGACGPNMCRMGPGVYYLEMNVACAAGEECVVRIKSED